MKWVVIAIAAIAGLALAWTTLPIREWLLVAVERIESLGPWGIAVYFALYFCLASATFPSTPLNVGAGLIFHPSIGFLVAWTAGALASMATFLFSRYVGRKWAERKLEALPQCEGLINALEGQGFKMVLLARMNPFIPASIKNFGFGLTAIPFWKYSTATLLGQLPIVLAYVYFGWAGSTTLVGDKEPTAMHYSMIAAGIVVSSAMLVLANWYGRKASAIRRAS